MTARLARLAFGVAIGCVAACGRDVRLGTAADAAPDAMADGNGNLFTAGTYTLAFLDPSMQQCDGTLVGSESSFAGITRASLGLIDGSVTFATPTGTTLTIAMAFGQGSLDLMPMAGNPPDIWDGLVSGDFGTGPLSTMRTATDLAIDSTTAAAPTIQGQIAVLYTTLDTQGACTVGFGAAFTKS